MNRNVIIVGVGGQGTLLASKLLGRVFMDAGLDVKVSEVHGMSQRGGSVITYVRAGDRVYSPVVEEGEADLILSFEQLESARWLPLLKKGGALVSNTQKIDPMSVVTGAAVYPEGVLDKIAALGVRVLRADALALAREAGSEKCANVALLGVAARTLGLPETLWQDALTAVVPPKFLEINRKAFALGWALKAE